MDPHRSLREDVRLLGELLGDTLRRQEGEALFETVERVRALAKGARADPQGMAGDFGRLAAVLGEMPVRAALPVARAFSHFLNLANIAEQHHRIRRRRAYQRNPEATPQPGSCDEVFGRLLAAGFSPDALWSAVCALRIELVLTAHPTEVARRTLLQKHNRIAAALAMRDRPDLTRLEQEEVIADLRREITAAWETDEVRHEHPSPTDEVRWGLAVFEQTLWDALPRYLRAVDRALRQQTGRGLPIDAAPVRFGTWMGGDRDGNPNVTPEVTWRACLMGRWVALELYLKEIDELRSELSMTSCSPALRREVGRAREPYRTLLRELRARLTAARAGIERLLDAPAGQRDRGNPVAAGAQAAAAILDAGVLAGPLRLCYDSLQETGDGIIADGRLTDVLRRLAAFGLTLARLDIRQEAARHEEAIDAVTRHLGLGSYASWTEGERQRFLLRELAGGELRIPPDLHPDDEVADVLETCRTIGRIPPDSLGAYVITMASRPSDVLAVDLLQRACGVDRPLRVVPLFETAGALRTAGDMLRRLLSVAWYRERIAGRQEVMIGYSDSAKELGRLSAAWELYRAQEAIVAACRDQSVQVTLFHGRGGSLGRGGGPTYLAIQSQPSGSVDGTLRVTEQGEMIQTKFGLVEIAVRTMEVYTTATLEATVRPAAEPAPEWRAFMHRLSGTAHEAYGRIVHEHPRFLEYFRLATPEPELSAVKIGSRPARRRPGTDLLSLRAIPWQFAWTQTRLLLASWLGLEEALGRALSRGERDQVREMYRNWPFFRSTLDLVEMVLAKADARIAAQYDAALVPPDLQPLGDELRRRLAEAVRVLLEATGHAVLLEDNPVLRRSIGVRNPYVDPINLVQIEVLRRLRRATAAAERDEPAADLDELHHAFVATVNGIAAGMRNTG